MQLFLSHWAWALFALPLFCACSSRPVKTIENMKNIVVSEQNAAVRYWAFSVQAKEEGYHNIANLLGAVARSEEIHAQRQQKMLSRYGKWDCEATDTVPRVGSTFENLKTAVRVERYESETVIPIFLQVAASEGLNEAEQFFMWLSSVACRHADYCCKALEKLEKDSSDCNVVNSWSVCPMCGCPYTTATLSEACDVCETPASSFFLFQ